MAKEKKSDLQDYVEKKLRSASQKWPDTYNTKHRVKVPVSVAYNPGDDFVTVTSQRAEITLMDGTLYVLEARVFTVPIKKKASNRERMMYMCEACKRLFFDKEWVVKKDGGLKHESMIAIDHFDPVVDLATGFVDWNTYITRLFPGQKGLQNLCNYSGLRDGVQSCHKLKTAVEKAISAARERKEKGLPEPKPKKTKAKKE
jgi:hypothetical protein